MTKNNSKRTYTKEFKNFILKRLNFPTNEKNIRSNCSIVDIKKKIPSDLGDEEEGLLKKA